MNYANPSQTYRDTAMLTASAGQRVLLLYEGAIRFLERAQAGFQHTDPLEFNQTIHNNIIRAQAIIRELNRVLNMEAGGELSATLRRLYRYFDDRLQASNLAKKDDGIKEVIGRLTVLRDAWAQMLSEGGSSRNDSVALAVEGGA